MAECTTKLARALLRWRIFSFLLPGLHHFHRAAIEASVTRDFCDRAPVGGIRRLYAWSAIQRKFVLLGFFIGLQIAGSALLSHVFHDSEILVTPRSALQKQLGVLAFGAVLSLALGYAFFMFFFSREGTRYFRTQTEVELAGEIHRRLVPRVEAKIGCFEVFGASVPSGLVGGDLVDFVEHERGGWTGYVADVSGHGVPSGVLMAMFKTAMRIRATGRDCSARMLEEVHSALFPLKMQNMFITAGILDYHSGNSLSATMAGHPPLLHFHAHLGKVEELPADDMPLGILASQSFSSRAIPFKPGDVFVLLTDGLTEVFDADGQEMSAEALNAALCEHAGKPLPELFRQLRQVALSFGRQEDDQTMLLVRACDKSIDGL